MYSWRSLSNTLSFATKRSHLWRILSLLILCKSPLKVLIWWRSSFAVNTSSVATKRSLSWRLLSLLIRYKSSLKVQVATKRVYPWNYVIFLNFSYALPMNLVPCSTRFFFKKKLYQDFRNEVVDITYSSLFLCIF